MKYYLRSGRVKTIPRGQDTGESRSRGQVNHELVFTKTMHIKFVGQ